MQRIFVFFFIIFFPSQSYCQEHSAKWNETVTRGIEYLRVRGQASDGSFSSAAGVGPTAVVAAGMLSVGLPPEHPTVSRALAFLESHVQPDGGIYKSGSLHRNYDTCLAMTAFERARDKAKYGKIIAHAEAFVRMMQVDESEGRNLGNLDYGGAGYGRHERPDLSNTSFLVDALHDLGVGPEDEAIQKALIFVSRCQNLESQHNTSPHSTKINDGGFYYTVANGGETKAGTEPNGGLRSYGSMTYAGLKSMIYAGVNEDDPRVQAAIRFLRSHYSLEENPGVGQQGLFYYYQTMSKALGALGKNEFIDSNNSKHQWKSEIVEKLASLQRPDGSWTNPTTRWMEGDPNLVTGYVLMTLANCKPGSSQ